jgi:hypothetical protein
MMMVGNLPPCRVQPLTRVGMTAPSAPPAAPGGLTTAGILFQMYPISPIHTIKIGTIHVKSRISEFVINVGGVSCDLLLVPTFGPETPYFPIMPVDTLNFGYIASSLLHILVIIDN